MGATFNPEPGGSNKRRLAAKKAWETRRKRVKARPKPEKEEVDVARPLTRLTERKRLLGAAEAYFAELSLFALPPEEIPLQARPELYVTALYVPEEEPYGRLRQKLEEVVKRGIDTELEVEPTILRRLTEDCTFNLNHRQARALAAFKLNDKFVIVEAFHRAGETLIKARASEKLFPLSTVLLWEYKPQKGLSGEGDLDEG